MAVIPYDLVPGKKFSGLSFETDLANLEAQQRFVNNVTKFQVSAASQSIVAVLASTSSFSDVDARLEQLRTAINGMIEALKVGQQ